MYIPYSKSRDNSDSSSSGVVSQSVFIDFSERRDRKWLKNIIEVTFPDSGVSVLYVLLCIVFSFFFFFFFLFLFFIFILMGVGRSSSRVDIQHVLSLRFRRKKVR